MARAPREAVMEDSLIEGHPLECSICLERMKDISFLTTQPDAFGNICNHYFCTKCIQPLIAKAEDPKCPCCRRSVLAVNKSRVANELLSEVEIEREQRKKITKERDDFAKELSSIKQKYEEELAKKAKINADEITKCHQDVAKAKDQSMKFRKACEYQLDEERKQRDAQVKALNAIIKVLQEKLGVPNLPPIENVPSIHQDLQGELDAKTRELEKQTQNLEHYIKELEDKTKEVEYFSQELDSKAKEIEDKEREVDEKNREIEEKNEIIQQKDSKIIEQENQLAIAKETLENRNAAVSDKTRQLISLSMELENCKKELEMKSREVMVITKELERRSMQLEVKTKELEDKNREISKRGKETDAKSIDLDIKTKELEIRTKELALKTKELASKSKEFELLAKDLQVLKTELEGKNNEVEKWHQLYQRTADELNKQKHFRPRPEVETLDNSNSPLNFKSWMSPLKTPLSYLWAKSGPLTKNSAEYQFLERRGSNRNSMVWKAQYKSSTDRSQGKIIALLKTGDGNVTESFREAMLLYKLDHKNILKLSGILRDVTVPGANATGNFLELPFVPLDLEYLLSDQMTYKLKSSQVSFIMYQILSALSYLHSAEVAHRDIKPTSILLDEACNVKLGSFGNARSLHSQPLSKVPPTRYSAPENSYMTEMTRPFITWKAGDIWGVGVIFFEILKGSPLFEYKDKNSFLSQVFAINESRPTNADIMRHPVLNSVPAGRSVPLSEHSRNSNIDITPESLDLLSNMLAFDPGRRITASDALKHKYFVKANFVDVQRTCPLENELMDEQVSNFVVEYCGGE